MPKKSLFVILFKIFKNKKKRKFSLSFWPKKNLGTCVTKKIACSNPKTICIQIWTSRDFLVSKYHLFLCVCVWTVCVGGVYYFMLQHRWRGGTCKTLPPPEMGPFEGGRILRFFIQFLSCGLDTRGGGNIEVSRNSYPGGWPIGRLCGHTEPILFWFLPGF